MNSRFTESQTIALLKPAEGGSLSPTPMDNVKSDEGQPLGGSAVTDACGSWVSKGKTIRGLIAELMSFEDQDMRVEMSVDGGVSSRPISLVGKLNGKCLLFNLEEAGE